MKKIISSIIAIMIFGFSLQAQTAPTDTLAQRMKDSLSLTNQQASQISSINATIGNKQAMLRKMFEGTTSLPYYLQKMEANRDSLYKAVLPNDKYLMYMSKRANIIVGN